MAECRALHDGLALAKHCGIKLNAIFSDCFVLVQACRSGVSPGWHVSHWWKDTLALLQDCGSELSHIFREGNQVADALASFACASEGNKIFTRVSELPPSAKGAFRVDKAGLPSFRWSKF